ncbi:MAG: hypothetical protein KF724_05900 [Phycisphaeraceae bacterium]|nr:hypothetical protein [Phycisphaeraceae bacterium]
MRFALFILVLGVTLAVDAALMPALELGGAVPSTTAILVVFVLLLASRDAAWFAAVAGGAALDLMAPIPFDGRTIVVVGPWALGFAFGGQLVLTLRGALVRRHALTLAVATFVFLMASTVVWCAIWSLRGWLPESLPPWGGDSVLREFAMRSRWALWSGAVALPIGWLLMRTIPAWGFPGVAGRSLR